MGYVIGQDDVSNGSMTATEIKEALETLTGDDRLDADYVKDIPSGSANIELITEQTVTGSSVADITFSSLDFSDYYRVDLIGSKVKTTAGSNQTLRMQLNGITTAGYGSTSVNNETSANIGIAWNTDEDTVNPVTMFINPSSTNERKAWRTLAMNFGVNPVVYDQVGSLQNAIAQATREAAITSIKVFAASGNLDVDTNFKLIGYKY